MVVDDNMTNRQVAIAIIEKLGYRANVVVNGKEALTALKQTPYDLVFMDCQMPEMDGYEATRQIRSWALGIGGEKETVHGMLETGEEAKGPESSFNDPISNFKFLDSSIKSQTSPVFDCGAFLERLMGDEELVKIVIAGFLENIPKQILDLEAFIKHGNAEKTGAQAHKIKGAASNVSGMAMSAVALEMETASKRGDLGRAATIMPVLEKEFKRLQQAMGDK